MWYSVCAIEATLDNYFTESVFRGLSCFPFLLHHFLALSTLLKEMEIVEKEGVLPVFDTGIYLFFLSTAEITVRLGGLL